MSKSMSDGVNVQRDALSEGPVSVEIDIPCGDSTRKVWFRRATPLDAPRSRDHCNYGRQILRKGELRRPGARPLPCDILFEPDVPVVLRDETIIYADILRPVGNGKFPSIVSWGPFGKSIGCVRLEDFPKRTGVPLDATTELMKWEAVDPGYWVDHGYAVLHPDARGSFRSQGNIQWMGRQEAEDGYDFIEWAAAQTWSNGHIGMAGNSWLAIMQWFIAAQQPPHLSAIAPWEGASDLLREFLGRGGIPNPAFADVLTQALPGERLVEDIAKMVLTEKDFTGYWQEKRVDFSRVKTPAYIVASYDNDLHTPGTFAAWRKIASKEKWLRIHNTHEWRDLYDPDHTEDLRRFFDHYLKGVDNGWENTPRIRAAVLDPGREDELGRAIESFPPDWPHQILYLTDNEMLDVTPQTHPANVAYPVGLGSSVTFRIKIPNASEIIGYSKLKLWVEAEGSDDMDLWVTLGKLDPDGGNTLLRPHPYAGVSMPLQATGMLRVSRRDIDPERSTPSEPFLSLVGAKPLAPSEIVSVEIGLWPIGFKIHAGEILEVTVSPYQSQSVPLSLGAAPIEIPADRYTYDPAESPEMLTLSGSGETVPAWVGEQSVSVRDCNKGIQRLYFGGQYDSHLLVPLKEIGS